jgi:hypothetical protein
MRRKTHFADRFPFSQPAADPSGRGAWLAFFARRMLIQPALRAAAFGTLAKSARVRFSDTRQAATGRLRKFGGCDPAGIQGCISHDESLVLVQTATGRAPGGAKVKRRVRSTSYSVRSVLYEELSVDTSCLVPRAQGWHRSATDDARLPRTSRCERRNAVDM